MAAIYEIAGQLKNVGEYIFEKRLDKYNFRF